MRSGAKIHECFSWDVLQPFVGAFHQKVSKRETEIDVKRVTGVPRIETPEILEGADEIFYPRLHSSLQLIDSRKWIGMVQEYFVRPT